MKELVENFKKDIDEADIALIGIGNELQVDMNQIIEDSHIYIKNAAKIMECDQEKQEYIRRCIYYYEYDKGDNILIKDAIKRYNDIKNLINSKEYFIISTNIDDIIRKSDIESDRIVTPCGSIHKIHCYEACDKEVWETDDSYKNVIEQLINTTWNAEDIIVPHCKKCNNVITANVLKNGHYSENGYLEDWERYTKWLQRTINKKLVIAELGEGFNTPTVMRWPFEKINFINQKSKFYRVNKSLYQISAELNSRAYGVAMDSTEFVDCVARV